MKISVMLPTMNRIELLEKAVSSLLETTSNYDIELITIVDKDEQSYNLMTDLSDKYQSALRNFTTIFNKEKTGALNSWNQALSLSSGDILFPYGDDEYCYPNWLDYALESHRDRLGSYGCVGLNDLAYDGNKQLATIVLFDRLFCKNVLGGVIAFPVYHYYCIDSEINERSKRAGKFYWDDRSRVEHVHSAHGKRPIDQNDLDKMNTDWMEQDNILFEKRKELGFPNDFQSVI